MVAGSRTNNVLPLVAVSFEAEGEFVNGIGNVSSSLPTFSLIGGSAQLPVSTSPPNHYTSTFVPQTN